MLLTSACCKGLNLHKTRILPCHKMFSRWASFNRQRARRDLNDSLLQHVGAVLVGIFQTYLTPTIVNFRSSANHIIHHYTQIKAVELGVTYHTIQESNRKIMSQPRCGPARGGLHRIKIHEFVTRHTCISKSLEFNVRLRPLSASNLIFHSPTSSWAPRNSRLLVSFSS